MRPLLFLAASLCAFAQQPGTNTDESKVKPYTLPDVLVSASGAKITNSRMWERVRRPEILKLFETEMFGRVPARLATTTYKVTEEDKNALGGTAIRKQVTVLLTGKDDGPQMEILLYLPAKAKGRVPLFAGLNFGGNQTVHTDPAIHITKSWTPKNTPAPRGSASDSWQVEKIISRGYGLATVYCGDLDPDFDDGFKNGVHPLYPPTGDADWATMSAWAWGLSRTLDYLEKDKNVDPKRVAVIGHSRLGKAAVWAGATDRRFAMVVSNDSGEGGAAISRRNFGETVKDLNTRFPHWYNRNYRKYNDNVATMPVESHMLLALIAPRPLYVASAAEDLWADPHGEFLGAYNAGPVYRLYGKQGPPDDKMPAIHEPKGATVTYHVRAGKHAITAYDWGEYLNFADRNLRAH